MSTKLRISIVNYEVYRLRSDCLLWTDLATLSLHLDYIIFFSLSLLCLLFSSRSLVYLWICSLRLGWLLYLHVVSKSLERLNTFLKICPSVYDKLHRTVSRNVHLAAWSSWPPSGESGRLETGPFTGPEQDPHWTLSSNQWRLDTSDVIRSIHRGHLPIDMKLGVGLDCSLANFQRSKVVNRMRYIHGMVKGGCLAFR